MKTLARLAAALVAALSLVALALAPLGPSASARLAPVLTIQVNNPQDPVRVPLTTDPEPSTSQLDFTVTVSGGPATNVTVVASGPGLAVAPPAVALGSFDGPKSGHVDVAATTGGFHQLTFTVTADGAAPAAAALPYVWSSTDVLSVAPGPDLAHTYFGVTGLYSENGSSYEDRSMLLFLTRDIAYYGVPAAGRPKCKQGSLTASSGCLTYAYDANTHLIQIGDSIGTVDKKSVHTIGLGITDYQGGEVFAHRDWTQQLQLPNNHNRYNGTWRWVEDSYCVGCDFFVALTLHKDGTFVLLDNWKRKRTIRGRYDVSRFGRMVLTGQFGKEIHTFSVLLNKKGKPDPRLGVTLGYGKGKNTDVVFLEPKKK